MKCIQVTTLFLMLVFCTSCGRKNKPELPKENITSETKEIVPSPVSDDLNFHTKYAYTDSVGKRLTIQNGLPRGGSRYTDPSGEVYGYAVFWTRFINETDDPLELNINFLDSYEVPSAPDEYFKLFVPPDTMTIDKETSFNYALINLESLLDDSIHTSSTLKRTIKPNESSAFYVVKLSRTSEGPRNGGDILRTGLSLKGQDLFYSVSVYNRQVPASIVSEKEIYCGSINLKNLIVQK